MNLVKCLVYYGLTGFVSFLFGRFVPKKLFKEDLFPYRAYAFEKNGALYERIAVKSWQNKLPDMSKILPGLIPPKSVSGALDSETVELMLKETCIAEFVHWMLFIVGFGSFRFFKPGTAVIICIIYCGANLPFIIVQRYNRPRLKRLLASCRRRERELAEVDMLSAKSVPAVLTVPEKSTVVSKTSASTEKDFVTRRS